MKIKLISPVYLLGSSILTAACNRTPTRIDPPQIDASAAAALALELYDRDGDGLLSSAEAKRSPPLSYALSQGDLLDSSGDGHISAEEITARIEAWQEGRAGLIPVRCVVILNDQPLAGATIIYEPAEFLKGSIKPAVGETDELGEARMSLRPEDLPNPNAPSGVQPGWYRVQVSKTVNGQESIPAEFNSNTVLGQEISFQDPGLQSQIVHRLTSP